MLNPSAFVIPVSLALAAGALQTLSPAEAVAALLDADRKFSADGAKSAVVDSLSKMFADDVIMPVPGNRFAEGRARVIEAMRENPDNLSAHAEWAPIRAGISADGQHGFTFGYMTLHRPDGSTVPLKYLAYWIRRDEGWRVVAYKRRARAAGGISTALMAPSLPGKIVPPGKQPPDGVAESLKLAEGDFSATAQRIGIGEAFAQFGAPDAMNMGGLQDAAFVFGAAAIGRNVGAGVAPGTSPFSWSADRVLVASSGDLGITFGMIRRNDPAAAGSKIPFFTIWRRADPSQPWRYIAE